MSRLSPKLNTTLPADVRARLEALAAEDAAERGGRVNLGATLAALVNAETKRRAERAKRRSTEP